MYTHRRYTISVRAGAARYGGRPIPSEDFPGAGVLDDLADAVDADIPLILARFAALRAWVLATDTPPDQEPDEVTRHALSAALEHLAATEDGWRENELLRGAVTGPRAESLKLLAAAAAAAERIGHEHGGRALREAVHRARWSAGGFPPPCPS